jgi:hypothetical protein
MPRRSNLFFLYNRAQFLPRQQRPAYVVSASSSGPRFDWQPCDQDAGHIHSTSPQAVAKRRKAHELPASLSPCHAATVPQCRVCPPFGTPVSVPGDRAQYSLGPDPTTHAPELRETTSTTGGVNLDIQYLCKKPVHFEKTEFSLSMTKRQLSCRKWRSPSQSGPVWGSPVPRTASSSKFFPPVSPHRPAAPNATGQMATSCRYLTTRVVFI